jgi:hypothetical protein
MSRRGRRERSLLGTPASLPALGFSLRCSLRRGTPVRCASYYMLPLLPLSPASHRRDDQLAVLSVSVLSVSTNEPRRAATTMAAAVSVAVADAGRKTASVAASDSFAGSDNTVSTRSGNDYGRCR